MVWFTCSHAECEAKAEGLVEATIGNPNGRFTRAMLNANELPDGWSRFGVPTPSRYRDNEHTFCPTHKDPKRS